MALREVPIPTHISILYVEQEVTGDNISAIEAVLKADVWRDKLMSEEAALNAELAALEAAAAASVKAANEAAAAAKAEGSAPAGGAVDMPTRQREIRRDELTARLGEVQAKLVDMEAETGPSRAAALLSGLGILDKDQSKPTSGECSELERGRERGRLLQVPAQPQWRATLTSRRSQPSVVAGACASRSHVRSSASLTCSCLMSRRIVSSTSIRPRHAAC
jgi:ATPase subunit of ABC transporter with duplicated ATPase domains